MKATKINNNYKYKKEVEKIRKKDRCGLMDNRV